MVKYGQPIVTQLLLAYKPNMVSRSTLHPLSYVLNIRQSEYTIEFMVVFASVHVKKKEQEKIKEIWRVF